MQALAAKKENGFDRLARLMQEGFEELDTNLRNEIRAVVESQNSLENTLRMEMREMEERLHYRMGKIATDVYDHLGKNIEPKIGDHERRIVKLEHKR